MTQTSSVDRARLLELIKELAVVRGKVTLSSGAEADYYIDLRRVTLHHEASRLVGRVMLQMLDEAGIDFDLMEVASIMRRTPYIAGLGWLGLIDGPDPDGLTVGLLDEHGKPKPAYYAYRAAR